jgi:hypothetical protein
MFPAVQLDHEALRGPDAVPFDPVFSEVKPSVGLRGREASLGEEAQKAVLELAAGDAGGTGLLAKDLPQDSGPWWPG